MIKVGDLVRHTFTGRHWRGHEDRAHKLGVVIESLKSKPIQNTSCFDGPTHSSRTRVAWVDGSGLQWVNTSDLKKESE